MNERGFTLVEVLVALLLTGLVAVLAYSALASALGASQSSDSEAQRLRDLDRAFRLLQRDLTQLVARPVTNGFGESEAVFAGASGGGQLLALTRGGWPDARGEQRSELQRVAWRWQENRLWRDYWTNTDRAPAEESVSTLVLENIEDIRLRFLDGVGPALGSDSAQWRDSWYAPTPGDRLPAAVEIVLTVEAWGEIRRLFVLPADA